jgi:hypothetical protein
MIFFVLDDPDKLDPVLRAWEGVGIHGATIIESTGLHRKMKQHVPMRYMFPPTGLSEEGHLTILAIVENQEMVQTCIQVTEQVIGSLDDPHTGVLAAWSLDMVKGVPETPNNSGG